MNIAIVGSRSITDKVKVHTAIDYYLAVFQSDGVDQFTILSGGAKGVDDLAEQYAVENKHDYVKFEPYHKLTRAEFKPQYYFVRNKSIVRNADIVLAFWDGKSKGTANTIDYANKIGKEVIDIRYE